MKTFRFKLAIFVLFLTSLSLLFIISCGGGSEINGVDEILGVEEKDDFFEEDAEDKEEEEEELQLLSGVLLDSPVEGVAYQSSVSGITDNLGTYFYYAGDDVKFTIGGIDLGTATASTQITPIDLVGTTDLTDQKLVNIIRLIQTLDDDGDPTNGITITSAIRTAAQNTTVNFNQSTSAFAANIASDISTITSQLTIGATTLVSSQSAVSHFIDTVTSSTTGSTDSVITVTKNAPTAITLSASFVAENQPSGTTVGSLTGTDPDNGDELTFTLVSGTGDSGNSSFAVSGSSLVTSASFTYDTQSSYSIRLRATDLSGETYEQTFTISITKIALSSSSVAENESSGTTVGTLSVTGAGSSETHTFELISGTSNFSISGSTLLTAASFDYETATSHSITVRITNSSGVTDDQTLTVTVTNVNDAPTAVSLSSTSVTDPVSGTAVGTLATTDADSGDSHTYTITSGSSNFSLSGTSLQAASILNAGTYSVTIQTADSGGLTTSKSLTITVSLSYSKWIIYQAGVDDGNLGGYTTANSTCNGASNKPTTKTGYAFASFTSETEIRDIPQLTGKTNAVAVYGQDTTTLLAASFAILLDGTTNIQATLQNANVTDDTGGVLTHWNFSENTGALHNSNTCSNGTSNSNSISGENGFMNSTTAGDVVGGGGSTSCDQFLNVLCITTD